MPTIYDAYGRPVDLGALRREIATATVSGTRSIWHDSVASGLTPSRLAEILRTSVRDDSTEFLTLCEEIEEREFHYRSVMQIRKLAITGLDIKVDSPSDEARMVEITDAVRQVIGNPDFEDVVMDLLDAIGKGFSVVEILWDSSSGKKFDPKFRRRDQRFFRFDRDTGETLTLRDDADPMNGVQLPPYKFMVHRPKLKSGIPIRSGLARVALAAYMCKSFTLRDWMAFGEVYGMPVRVGKYGPGATSDDILNLVNAVANIGMDAAAVIPQSMMIDFVQAANVAGADAFFKGKAGFFDEQISKIVLGQTMTTDNGSSLSQAQVHNDVRGDVQKADARAISRTINRDLVRPYVDLNFGPQETYPEVEVFVEEPEDLKTLSESLSVFIDRGLKVQASEVRDRFGFSEPEDGAELLTPVGPGTALPGEGEPPEPPPVPGPPAPPKGKEETNALQAGDPFDAELNDLMREGLLDFEEVMDPVLDPVRELAAGAKDENDFIARLPEVLARMDNRKFTERVALLLFKARGYGDGE